MEEVGVGRCAEIFAVSEDHVLKLYESQFGAAIVERWAGVGKAVHLAGVRSPEVHALESLGDRHGIVLERIHGVTLWEAIARAPQLAEEYGAALADLHIDVHRTAIDGLIGKLVELSERVEARRQHDRVVDDALAIVEHGRTMPQVLLHGDLHPANVMIDESDGSLISIDWDGAMSGPAPVDIARTHYLVSSWALAPGTAHLVEPLRTAVAGAFLERYEERADFSITEVSEWRLPVVLARYAENVPGENQLLDQQVASLTSAVSEHVG